MQTLRRIVAVLTFPAMAWLGAACERTDTPTGVQALATVADPPCSVPTFTHPTIQSALNDPLCNPINVAAGTYVENDTIRRTVTLNGAQAGVDARGRVASEAIVTPLVPTTATLILQTGSRRSIIDGFTFLGGAFADGSGHLGAIESITGPIDSLQILNNRIRGFTAGSGVFLNDNGINITVDQNDIDGTMRIIGNGDLFHLDQDNFDGFWFTNNRVVNGTTGNGFFVDGNRNVDAGTAGARIPRFVGNLIANNRTGVNLGRKAWGDGPITGNTFSNNVFDGLQGGPKNSLISQNIFDGNGRNGLALTGFSALPSTDPTRGAQNNNVTQNCFTGNGVPLAGAGIFFSATQFPGTISSNVANQNNIFGNLTGAQYLGSETINAELNWWGSSTGPTSVNNPGGTGDAVVDNGPAPGGIDFLPFLTSAAGGTPCAPPAPPSGKVTGGGQVPVMGGTGSFGFNAKSDNGVGSGHLNYLNHFTGAHLDCTVDAVTMLTTTTAEFSGTCTSNSAAPNFSAHVEDHGNPGKGNDRFLISYGTTINEGGTLISGNIVIH